MLNHNQKRSKITTTLWLGMAVFFLLFCSSPVKKYIRLHLYSQKFIVEAPGGDHFSTYDVKDCLIADRHQVTDINLLTVLQAPANDPGHDIAFLIPSFLPAAPFALAQKAVLLRTCTPGRGTPVSIPLYLWVRHLQV